MFPFDAPVCQTCAKPVRRTGLELDSAATCFRALRFILRQKLVRIALKRRASMDAAEQDFGNGSKTN
ncbi:MAG: hypothetical protein B7Z55_04365 [Planctomycetales bacterium 12-60-4]|nr:MAG: hypothetical protein B7Z55_04365 [Planctomycetales bacterium 12-60-4]